MKDGLESNERKLSSEEFFHELEQMFQTSEEANEKHASSQQSGEPICYGCDVPVGYLHHEHCQLECCSACGHQILAGACLDHAPVRVAFARHSTIQDLHNVFHVVLNPRGKSVWLVQRENTFELWYTHRWLDGPDDTAERFMGSYDSRTEAVAAAEKFEQNDRFYSFIMHCFADRQERVAPLSKWLVSRSMSADQEASNADVLIDLFVDREKTVCGVDELESLTRAWMGSAMAGDWDSFSMMIANVGVPDAVADSMSRLILHEAFRSA